MIQLIQGDCIEVLKTLPEESINLTITSPPYDNLRTYKGTISWGEHSWKVAIQELFRVTKEGGIVVWIVGDATVDGSETGTSFRQALFAKECGFNIHDTMIFQKAGTGACRSNYAYWQSFEYMFVWSRGRPKTINRIADVENIRTGAICTKGRIAANGTEKDTKRRIVPANSVRTNVWRYQVGNNGDDRISHPARFPEKLVEDHILSWSNERDTVLDPFMGSGTTGKMAKLLGRNFIGIEIEREYVEIAQKRIDESSIA